MGFALSGAAGAGADALTELLKQKFLEQITRQRLAEEMRQADMQNAVQQRQLGQGDERLGLEGKRLGEDTRQFDVTSGQRNRTIALDEAMQPVQMAHIRSQTADIE